MEKSKKVLDHCTLVLRGGMPVLRVIYILWAGPTCLASQSSIVSRYIMDYSSPIEMENLLVEKQRKQFSSCFPFSCLYCI